MEFIAHRGLDNHNFKENSIEAFKHCFNTSYIAGVEIDVRLTKDKKVVISHDDYDGILKISNTKYKKLNVNLLEDVLKIANNKKIIIDIKGTNEIISHLHNIINKYKLNYYICSFNDEIIESFYKNYKYKTGLIIGYMVNYNKIKNKYNFNSLHYNLINRINKKKEIFLWTVNTKKELKIIQKHGDNFNIITDKAYMLK